jgi:type IV secretory pathway VirB4 component
MVNITKDNSKMFTVSFVCTIFADTEEDLSRFEKQFKVIANKHLLTVRCMDFQQEDALASALPLGNKRLYVERLMTTHSIASLIPFDVQEMRQEHGMYYGLNAVSRNMILYNRAEDKVNPNGCILGMPGAGKSFAAKREIINVLLNTDDEVYILDPEREYTPIAEAMNGSVIKLANGASTYINPFDMNLDNADDTGDPVKVKMSFVETIIEIMIGGKFGLAPIEKSIIDRSVQAIYEPYIQHLRRAGLKQDFAKAPSLLDFYNELLCQPQQEAQLMALSLERYVKGALDVFSHQTNIDINNRFTVYDIKDIGPGLKELGLQVCLDNIWNKMIQNFSQNKRTWIYIDEFYLLMNKESSSNYIAEIWKRARKWRGVPCAITQNVEDMMSNPDARTVINNCSMVMLLGQSPMNRQVLSGIFNISPSEQKYISSAKPGMGLLRIGETMIPMDDSFPKDTTLYKIMTTKPDERM